MLPACLTLSLVAIKSAKAILCLRLCRQSRQNAPKRAAAFPGNQAGFQDKDAPVTPFQANATPSLGEAVRQGAAQ